MSTTLQLIKRFPHEIDFGKWSVISKDQERIGKCAGHRSSSDMHIHSALVERLNLQNGLMGTSSKIKVELQNTSVFFQKDGSRCMESFLQLKNKFKPLSLSLLFTSLSLLFTSNNISAAAFGSCPMQPVSDSTVSRFGLSSFRHF